MCATYMPELARTFCDDEAVRQTLLDHAGNYSRDLYNLQCPQSPAHRADGLYLDIKCWLRMPFKTLLSHLAEEWGAAQCNAQQALGHCPTLAGHLPNDYMLMAIGNRGDHVFQGIIYCRPKRPLLFEAIIQFYSPQSFAGRAENEVVIFCKFLYKALWDTLGHAPQHGWNLSNRYGLV